LRIRSGPQIYGPKGLAEPERILDGSLPAPPQLAELYQEMEKRVWGSLFCDSTSDIAETRDCRCRRSLLTCTRTSKSEYECITIHPCSSMTQCRKLLLLTNAVVDVPCRPKFDKMMREWRLSRDF